MVGLLTPAEYNDCVEHAFRMHGLGRVYMEPKGHIVLERYKGEWEVMPSYIEEPEAAACKWVSIREDNSRYELPAVFSILVYTHPETGFPLAICDGSHHTLMRTGASAAVSAKWLAREDSKVLAILGAGSVGKGTLATCNEVFAWDEVRIWSRTQASLDRFVAEEQPLYPNLELVPTTDVEQAVRAADVIVTGADRLLDVRRRHELEVRVERLLFRDEPVERCLRPAPDADLVPGEHLVAGRKRSLADAAGAEDREHLRVLAREPLRRDRRRGAGPHQRVVRAVADGERKTRLRMRVD